MLSALAWLRSSPPLTLLPLPKVVLEIRDLDSYSTKEEVEKASRRDLKKYDGILALYYSVRSSMYLSSTTLGTSSLTELVPPTTAYSASEKAALLSAAPFFNSRKTSPALVRRSNLCSTPYFSGSIVLRTVDSTSARVFPASGFRMIASDFLAFHFLLPLYAFAKTSFGRVCGAVVLGG